MKRKLSNSTFPDGARARREIFSTEGSHLWTSDNVPSEVLEEAALAVKDDLKTQKIKLYGKEIPIPRRAGFYGPAVGYRYSGSTLYPPADVPEAMASLLAWAREAFPPPDGHAVGILVNRYESGSDYISFHADDEKNLDGDFVATVSTGADRSFVVKEKATKKTVAKLSTARHPMIVMEGPSFQKEYIHGVPKKATSGPRTSFSIRWHKI